MTIIDPAAIASPELAKVRKIGRVVVGIIAGVFALGFCVWFFNSQFLARGDLNGQMRAVGTPAFIATATIVSAFITGWLWDRFALNQKPLSWGWSASAGLLAVVLANILTWLVVLIYGFVWYVVSPVASGGLDPSKLGLIGTVVARALSAILATFLGLIFLAPFTIALTGLFTAPLAIIACLIGTAWSRRRLQKLRLAAYPSGNRQAAP